MAGKGKGKKFGKSGGAMGGGGLKKVGAAGKSIIASPSNVKALGSKSGR